MTQSYHLENYLSFFLFAWDLFFTFEECRYPLKQQQYTSLSDMTASESAILGYAIAYNSSLSIHFPRRPNSSSTLIYFFSGYDRGFTPYLRHCHLSTRSSVIIPRYPTKIS